MSELELAHFGVKGMKWGVRKDQEASAPEVVLKKSLKGGGSLVVTKDPPVLLQKIFPKLGANWSHFTLSDGDGAKVGEASFRKLGEDELNLVWIEVKGKHRGKGYASAAVEGALNYAKDKGLSKLTLEVPGISPDARHIYEKMGFQDKGMYKDSTKDDIWGGLTRMELAVPKTASVKHADSFQTDLLDYIVEAINKLEEGGEMAQSNSGLSNFLSHVGLLAGGDVIEHYGIKGMKWGVRRATDSSGRVRSGDSPDYTESRRLKRTPNRQLSTPELERLNKRLQLERSNRDLANVGGLEKIKKGNAAINTVLAVGITANAALAFANSPAGKALKASLFKK